MANKDLVVKMTINSNDFDNGLKNAKTSMDKFNKNAYGMASSFKSAISGMTKAFAALGVAIGAKDIFNSFIKSTESSSDSFRIEIESMKDAWNAFLYNINTGNFTGFSTLIQYAKKAKIALDELGDLNEGYKLDSGHKNKQLTELLNQIQKKKKSGEDYSGELDKYNRILEGMRSRYEQRVFKTSEYLNNTLAKYTIHSIGDVDAVAYQDGFDYVNYTVDQYRDILIKARDAAGGLYSDLAYYNKVMNQTYLSGYGMYGSSYYEKDSKRSRAQLIKEKGNRWVNEMETLSKLADIPEEEKKAMEAVISSLDSDATAIEQYDKALNRYLETTTTISDKLSVPAPMSPQQLSKLGMTDEQIAQFMVRAFQNESLNADWFKNSVIIDFEIPEEEIFEPETEELMNRVAEQMKLIQDRTKYAAAAMSSFGQAFGYAADIAGDNPFGNTLQALSGVTNAAISTASAMMTLTGAETMEGVAEAFASAPPYMKLAMAGTALAGILSMMAAVKSSFAGSYANGGIVGGNSYTGDKLWARVNSGEMIIPYNDWHNSNAAGNVHFVIEGSQLKGVLDNYDKTVSL